MSAARRGTESPPVSAKGGTAIRGPWWTRLLIYWALPWLAWEAWRWRETGSPLSFLLFGLAIVWVCERYAFGYSVTLFPDRLVYNDRGFFLGRKISIERNSIIRAMYLRNINAENRPWRRVEIEYRAAGEPHPRVQVLSVVSFRKADVERILRWMPIQVEEG